MPSRRTARALRKAFSTATAAGSSPCCSSLASETVTVNGTPRRSSRARRCGEPEASTSGSVARAAATALGAYRSSKNSAASRAADSGESEPWTMLAPISIAKSPRIDRADQLPRGPDGVGPLEHHRHDRARGDEVDELAEERALGVLGVVTFGEIARDGHVPQGHDAQALALEAGDDLAAEAAGEGVGLYEDQSSVHGFLWSVWKGSAAGDRSERLRSSGACVRRGEGRARSRGALRPARSPGTMPPRPRPAPALPL